MARVFTRLTQGRYLRSGVTWTSAAVTLVVILIVFVALGVLARRFEDEFPLTVAVVDHQVVGTAPDCAWEAELSFRNDSDRRLRLISVEVEGVDGSRQGLLGSFAPGEEIERTYRHTLTDCSAPVEDVLVARYGPALSGKERTVTFPVG